jgi:phosphate transport system substrate-binding protein
MQRIVGRRGAALIVTALALGALAASPKAAGAQTLTGAGSTFINPIMTRWIAAYKHATGVGINYQPIGSGGGINALINKTVNFAGSDAPMNAQELAQVRGSVLHLPVVIGAVVVGYNVPGVPAGLHLTGPILAGIFLGKITEWNDPSIARLNPHSRLPHARIFVAHRSDGSGTTYIFTDYLSKISPQWKAQVGTGKSVQWPAGLGGKGNEGVAGLLKQHANSIGYIELAYAMQSRIPYAAVQNVRGKFIMPSAETASVAAEGVKLPADMRASLTNTPNPNGYPVAGFSWLIVRENTPEAAPLKRFLNWVIGSGQSFTKPLAYAALPAAIRQRDAKLIASIK